METKHINKLGITQGDLAYTIYSKRVQSILDEMSAEQISIHLKPLLSSQGPLSTEYLIDKGFFTKQVVDFCQSVDFAQEHIDGYDKLVSFSVDHMKSNPQDYWLSSEDVENMDDDDYEDLVTDNGWLWFAYENFIIRLFQYVYDN